MKKQITKGKVIQSCMKVLAAVVVAGGVGFQYIENQELDKELATLNQVQKETVQTLEMVMKDNTNLEEQYGVLAYNADQLLNEVNQLKKEKKALQKSKTDLEAAKKELEKSKQTLQNEKQALQSKNNALDRELKKEKNRPRTVKAAPSSKSTTKVSAPKATAKATPKAAPAAASKKVVTASVQSTGKTVSGSATAYNANCEGCSGITASGKRVGPGMVAMASWVPLGTKVRITCASYPSINGVYTVEDRGGAIKGNKVDIFMSTHSQAIDFGRRDIKIEILN